MYVHINQGGGLSPESLFGTPGALQLATSGIDQQVNRGSHVMDGIPFFVNGSSLYRLDRTVGPQGGESFSLTILGTVEGEGRVSMADNGTQLCILSPGGKGYIYNESAIFEEIIDGDFRANGNPQHVIFIDEYFLFTTDTKKFIVSALNDGLSYNALDFGTAAADPDAIVAPVVNNNQLYICGSETIEVFRNQGGANFPFVRVEGGAISTGAFAAFSIQSSADTFFFIGGSENDAPSAYVLSGGGVSIISTDAIDGLLAELSEDQIENVFGWHYSQNGSFFVGWTLPTTTIVYDLTAKRWHERKSFAVVNNVAEEFRWRANSVTKGYGRILVGDALDGRVGELDLDHFDEYGQNIIRVVSTLPFSNLGSSIRVPSIELTVESGVGNATDPDPLISFDWSKDGKTYTDKRERSFGRIGDFIRRLIWRRNGRFPRMAVFRFTSSDKVKQVWIKLKANIT